MQGDRSVAAVILAAGTSRRFGSPKQLAVVEGRSLIEHVMGAAMTAGLEPVVVVVPVWLSPPGALDAEAAQWVRNPFPERGMSHSLRLGLGALGPRTSAALILLGDQPGMQAATMTAVVGARGSRPIVAASAEGVLAPPVLIERSHFHLAFGLSGDVGLRELLRENPDLVTTVTVPAHAVDVDTPEDLGRVGDP
jgi:CTP:molybdopterin cytidylyltransferase MocA